MPIIELIIQELVEYGPGAEKLAALIVSLVKTSGGTLTAEQEAQLVAYGSQTAAQELAADEAAAAAATATAAPAAVAPAAS